MLATDAGVLVEAKVCTKCGHVLPQSAEFFKTNQRMADGLSSWCRECHRFKDRQAYRRNPEPIKERSRAHYEANKERHRQQNRAWRTRNRERAVVLERCYRILNRDQIRANHRRHRTTEGYRETTRISLWRRRHGVGVATVEQVAARVAYWGHRCWMCRGEWEEIDHVIPLSRGGTNWPANLRPICVSCNRHKSNRLLHKEA